MAEKKKHAFSEHHYNATTLVEPDDILIADPRGGLTPCQMVDNKLLALLACGRPEFFTPATGRLEDIRRILGK